MERILIVDDEKPAQNLLKRIFEKEGYSCETASNAGDARRLLEGGVYQLVLCDIRMPGESGLDLVRHVQKKYPDTAVVMVTAVDDPKEAKAALEIGVYGYLIKPFESNQMLICVENALRRRKLEIKERRRRNELERAIQERTAEYQEVIRKLQVIEKDLRESEEKFRVAVEYSNDGVAIAKEGKRIYVNKKFSEIFGYESPAEMIETPIVMVVHPDDRPRISEIVNKRLKGEAAPSRYQFKGVRKDGQTVWIEASVGMSLYRQQSVTLAFYRDITDGKRAESALLKATDELKENKEKLQRALERISLLIEQVVTSKDFSVRFENPNLVKCCDSMDCRKTDCPCYGKPAMRCWQTTGTFCSEHVKGEFAAKIKDCRKCPVFKEACRDPFCKIGEQFNNMMHILEVKNTELKKTYRELRNSQAQIIQQEKMASIGQLAAGVAHEINNPTGFVSSNLKTLSDYRKDLFDLIQAYRELILQLNRTQPPPDGIFQEIQGIKDLETRIDIDFVLEDIPNLIAESREGTDRIKKIVLDLKDFAHPGKQDLVYANINKNLDSTLNIVWNEIKYKATVAKEYGEIPEVRCYPQQLNQVFMNLLVNAAQAIEKKGEIKILTRYLNGHVEIRISDTGCGIPEAHLGKIFEPFFTTKEVGKGTGLGLHVAYNIIQKHRGTIAVESKAGSGTAFTIKIPVNGRENTDDENHNV
jgi:PAS domain S-box-containing protein